MKKLLLKLADLIDPAKKADFDKIVSDAPDDPPPASGPAQSPDTKALIEKIAALEGLVTKLQGALTEEAAKREAGIKAENERLAKEKGEKITKALDDAFKAGKFPAEKKDEWKKRLESDYDGYSAVLNDLPGKPGGSGEQPPGGQKKSTGVLDPLNAVKGTSTFEAIKKASSN